MITFLSGGTGTPKLIQGFRRLISDKDLTVIANTGDDIWLYGLYISPDIDTILYLFSGFLDEEKYWGIKEDTFNTLSFLREMGLDTWFRLGDRDIGLHLQRTRRVHEGLDFSKITQELKSKLKIEATILPCSDNHIETRIITEKKEDIHFQEFWVKYGGNVNIKDVYVKGIENAKVPPIVLDKMESSDLIIVGPSNPITSIGPIIDITEIRNCLRKNKEKCIAISPIIGDKPVSGPTGKLMSALGKETTPLGVARIYKDICDTFVIHETDEKIGRKIEDEIGMEVLRNNIIFKNTQDAEKLANFILKRS